MSKRRTPDRAAPGRPAGHQGKPVRQLLLEASQQLFAMHGYEGVSVKAIADSAGVNPAMVHYYFGNKDGLFASVIEETLHPIISKVQQLDTLSTTESFIEQFLQIYMTTVAANPWFPVLLNREVLLPEGRLKKQFTNQVVAPVSSKIRKMIELKKKQGELDADIDPTLATINLISLAIFPFLSMNVVGKALNINVNDTLIENLSRHTTHVYLHGIHKSGNNDA